MTRINDRLSSSYVKLVLSSWNINRDFYSDVYTILNRILINDIDHMRISGIEPSSVILSQRKKVKKLKYNAQKVPKEA